jgi:hypothetical protein
VDIPKSGIPAFFQIQVVSGTLSMARLSHESISISGTSHRSDRYTRIQVCHDLLCIVLAVTYLGQSHVTTRWYVTGQILLSESVLGLKGGAGRDGPGAELGARLQGPGT